VFTVWLSEGPAPRIFISPQAHAWSDYLIQAPGWQRLSRRFASHDATHPNAFSKDMRCRHYANEQTAADRGQYELAEQEVNAREPAGLVQRDHDFTACVAKAGFCR